MKALKLVYSSNLPFDEPTLSFAIHAKEHLKAKLPNHPRDLAPAVTSLVGLNQI